MGSWSNLGKMDRESKFVELTGAAAGVQVGNFEDWLWVEFDDSHVGR